jgi:hypothetical protein
MGRPRRTTEQEWYDVFADADVSEQVIMLRMAEELHRQTRRGKIGKQLEQPAAELAESETTNG